MSRTIARELDNQHQGDRGACPICSPKPDRVPAWKVWRWALAHPGQKWSRP